MPSLSTGVTSNHNRIIASLQPSVLWRNQVRATDSCVQHRTFEFLRFSLKFHTLHYSHELTEKETKEDQDYDRDNSTQ